MSFDLSLINSSALLRRQAAEEILALNDKTADYGLVLTPAEALSIAQTRSDALQENGRMEFGSGITGKIILAFRSSPYLHPLSYVDTLSQLTEIFYAYKNETEDRLSDDELILYMKSAFDGVCQGSLELLSDRELYRLAKNLRNGRAPDYREEDDDD